MIDLSNWTRIGNTQFLKPPTGKVACQICHIGDCTGYVDINNGKQYPSDMDSDIHEGFTIGKGKTMYFMMIWHGSGNVTVYNAEGSDSSHKRRWISGDTEIIIHWKNNNKPKH